jgi:cytochrome c oxidase cbb3-type subunit 3
MSGFWSGWIVVLAVLTLGISFFLFVWGLRVHIPVQSDGTTGHNWDGIREGMHKLPIWWVAASATAFATAFVYLALYPGLGNFSGTLGWTSAGEVKAATIAGEAALASKLEHWRGQGIEQLAKDPQALRIGGRIFEDNCAGCHGRKAQGNPALGAPNLTDADWQFGGSGEAILASVLDGRRPVMPPWGTVLGESGVNEVAAYVQSLSGTPGRVWLVRDGKKRFADFCMSCHGPTGAGQLAVAPNLTDHAWLYGGDMHSITASIRDGRTGVMPAWRARLGEDKARLAAAWVLAQAAPERAAPH